MYNWGEGLLAALWVFGIGCFIAGIVVWKVLSWLIAHLSWN